MDLKQQYREETGLEVYVESPIYNDHFSNEYVKWLEAKINYAHSSSQLKDKGENSFHQVSKEQFFKEWISTRPNLKSEFHDAGIEAMAFADAYHKKQLRINGVVSTCCEETRKVNQFLERPSKYCMTCNKELK